jgi:hypothetical protein
LFLKILRFWMGSASGRGTPEPLTSGVADAGLKPARPIELIVFFIFGMFSAIFSRNGREEQFKTIKAGDGGSALPGTRRTSGGCGRCGLEARSPKVKQRGTIPLLKANRPAVMARAMHARTKGRGRNLIRGIIEQVFSFVKGEFWPGNFPGVSS